MNHGKEKKGDVRKKNSDDSWHDGMTSESDEDYEDEDDDDDDDDDDDYDEKDLSGLSDDRTVPF